MRSHRFKAEFYDAQIIVSGYKKVITNANMTDEEAVMILKQEHLKHNIEAIPEGGSHIQPELEKLMGAVSDGLVDPSGNEGESKVSAKRTRQNKKPA